MTQSEWNMMMIKVSFDFFFYRALFYSFYYISTTKNDAFYFRWHLPALYRASLLYEIDFPQTCVISRYYFLGPVISEKSKLIRSSWWKFQFQKSIAQTDCNWYPLIFNPTFVKFQLQNWQNQISMFFLCFFYQTIKL